MLMRYISTAVRHLVAHKLYSAIDIAGLAVALAAAMLVGLFVRQPARALRYE
jgi:putative ABC transport system permease protein